MDTPILELGPLPLGPEMTIAHAAEIHQSLLQALPGLVGDPRVDLSGVSEFDSSGVQLLVALKSSLAERGQALQLVGAPAIVRNALEVFGLQAMLTLAAPDAAH
jgi:anti-anti-sigma factor